MKHFPAEDPNFWITERRRKCKAKKFKKAREIRITRMKFAIRLSYLIMNRFLVNWKFVKYGQKVNSSIYMSFRNTNRYEVTIDPKKVLGTTPGNSRWSYLEISIPW